MRPKSQNVCQQCRSRKLGCDGKAPACTQCTLRRIPCGGYPQDFVFVPRTNSSALESPTLWRTGAKSTTHQKQPSKQIKVMKTHQASHSGVTKTNTSEPTTDIIYSRLEHDICFIVENYSPLYSSMPAESNPWHNQICGAWVEALPLLFAKGQMEAFLASSIMSFAAALRHHCLGSDAIPSQALGLYCTSLGLVSAALQTANGILQVEHCAAIMCLAVTELVFPTSESSWMKHATAVENFFQRVGPVPCATGILHKLFVGFRPLILINSLLNRRRTFLAQHEWTTQPFQGQPITLMQPLLSKAACLPALLERCADSEISVDVADPVALEHVKADLITVLQAFKDWESAARSQSSSPLSWKRLDAERISDPDVNDLWFPDLATANSLTYCWAFELVVLRHLRFLSRTFEVKKPSGKLTCVQFPPETLLRHKSVELAEMICDSMAYLMQPDMKLWGPASAFFTFGTAFRTFKDSKPDCSSRLLHCQRIVDQLAKRRIIFPEAHEFFSE
ncbi:hypothetical protein FB567DRAFT_498711 [Paraphoma chrysanthemicola]|uniref:Zn(2)-C6 fungal-type domain-containing protein n=1 Tax=Paraphoma chrysanthemicola TaxID=798071 RepID=A0A8K0VXG9_9PLEO|nr:hypothetical protein FB567DRAFT_498711 [Paraphoma chrysanthemicola]